MCAALWTRHLERGLPGGTPSRPDGGPVATGDPVDAVWYLTCASPFGPLHLAATAVGVCAVGLVEAEARFRRRLLRAGGQTVERTMLEADASRAMAGAPPDNQAAGSARLPMSAARAVLASAVTELGEYFAGKRRAFSVPVDLATTTAFDRRVLAAMAAIQYGETRTYGELARAVGSPGAARAVGHACGRNPVPVLLPCHRVVRSGGGLGGYSGGGLDVKAALLALERKGTAC